MIKKIIKRVFECSCSEIGFNQVMECGRVVVYSYCKRCGKKTFEHRSSSDEENRIMFDQM